VLSVIFTELTSTMCTSTNYVRSTAAAAAAAAAVSQNSMQISSVCHQRTQQTFNGCGSYEHSGQNSSISGTIAQQQKLFSASNNIFKTPDLELTDADLEFSLK